MEKLNIDLEELKRLCEEGLTDIELAQYFNCTYTCVARYRRELGIPINPSRMSKFKLSKEDLQKYVDNGLKDVEIANLINVYPSTVYRWRGKYGIERKSFKENPKIELSSVQKQVLFGCVLGDGYLNQVTNKNSTFEFSHSYSQKDYVDYKHKFFNNFPSRVYSFLRKPHTVTGKCYNTYTALIHTNEAFNHFKNIFYKDGKKVIPIEHLEEFYTPLAMAIHYCDDGSCTKSKKYNSYVVTIATCSFSKKELEAFQLFLKTKYGIESTITKSNRVYIKAKSVKIFFDLIKSHIPDSMQYKLYDVS